MVHLRLALLCCTLSAEVRGQVPQIPTVSSHREVIRFAFVGDVNLGTVTMRDGLPDDEGRALFSAARAALSGDVVIANLEGPLIDGGRSTKCGPRSTACYAFGTPRHLADRLRDAGITHVNLANNHASDFGAAGRATTAATLASLGIRSYGASGAVLIDTITIGRTKVRVAMIGFAASPGMKHVRDIAGARLAVAAARGRADVIVVTMHAGAEGARAMHVPDGPERFAGEERGDLRRFTRAVIDEGASIVIGHGPHVLRGLEWYKGVLIAYSLGNFVTYAGFELGAPKDLTAVLQVELDAEGHFVSARIQPFLQKTRAGVVRDTTGRVISMLQKLSREDFGETAAVPDRMGTIVPLARTGGPPGPRGDAASP